MWPRSSVPTCTALTTTLMAASLDAHTNACSSAAFRKAQTRHIATNEYEVITRFQGLSSFRTYRPPLSDWPSRLRDHAGTAARPKKIDSSRKTPCSWSNVHEMSSGGQPQLQRGIKIVANSSEFGWICLTGKIARWSPPSSRKTRSLGRPLSNDRVRHVAADGPPKLNIRGQRCQQNY